MFSHKELPKDNQLSYFSPAADQPDPTADAGAAADVPAERPLRRRLLDLLHRPTGNRAR